MRNYRQAWHLLAAALFPFAALSTYLWAIRWIPVEVSVNWDYAALAAAIFVAIACLATMPAGWLARILTICAAVPVLSIALFYYSFLFVGIAFGQWL